MKCVLFVYQSDPPEDRSDLSINQRYFLEPHPHFPMPLLFSLPHYKTLLLISKIHVSYEKHNLEEWLFCSQTSQTAAPPESVLSVLSRLRLLNTLHTRAFLCACGAGRDFCEALL